LSVWTDACGPAVWRRRQIDRAEAAAVSCASDEARSVGQFGTDRVL